MRIDRIAAWWVGAVGCLTACGPAEGRIDPTGDSIPGVPPGQGDTAATRGDAPDETDGSSTGSGESSMGLSVDSSSGDSGSDDAVGGSSGDSSTGPSAPICGEPADPFGGFCPTTCNGGCSAGVCRIDCLGDACHDRDIVCPPEFNCHVICNAHEACQFSHVYCPPGLDCELDCIEAEACDDTIVTCGDGRCDIYCADVVESCDETAVACGTGACTATCEPGAEGPALDCGDACSCTPC